MEPRRLSTRVSRMLQRTSNELWLSPVSTWEVVLLAEGGKFRTNVAIETWLAAAMSGLGLYEAPLTHEVVLASREITLPHRDPADHLIAATARHYELRLVTTDARLLAGSGFSTIGG